MKKRLIVTMLAASMLIGSLAGCGGSSASDNAGSGNQAAGASGTETGSAEAGTVDTSEEVNLVLYLYGSEGVANKDILAALNEKLKEKINATLEVKYIDWGDISTKYPLLWSAGEDFDMAYGGASTVMPYATLAKQDALVDITDMLDQYAPTLKAAITQDAWDSVTVGGRIYGVPSTYSEFSSAYGFVSRTDRMKEYGIDSIDSIEDMEAYMDASVAAGRIPLNGTSNMGPEMYKMFTMTTNQWIQTPGISDFYLVGDLNDPENIISPIFTDEFEDFAVKMKDWADKGYWPTDVLAATTDDKDNFLNDMADAYISHQPDWTGQYGTMQTKLPGVDTEFFCFPETTGTIVATSGSANMTLINANSKNKERTLMMIELLMTDKECYDLLQYGIEGRQYEIQDGKIVKPASYNEEKDAGGFCAWAMRTDDLSIPYASEDERRYTLNEEWKKVAVQNPYTGFSFDDTDVSAELSAISNVNSQLGMQIMLGKTAQDPKDAVAEYRKQLEAAGINDVIEAVKTQYADFLASKSGTAYSLKTVRKKISGHENVRERQPDGVHGI